jgi:signal peptidase II
MSANVSLSPGQPESTRQPRDWRGWLLALTMLLIWADRLTKQWVEKHVPLGGGMTIIPHTFRISHVYNSGAAFSLFNDTHSPQKVRWFLIGFSALASVAVFVALLRVGRRFTATSLALALILAGAIGNSFDRIRYGYVIDFLYVQLHFGSWHYHWPDFNVADSSIVVGGILLMVDALLSTRAAASFEASATYDPNA